MNESEHDILRVKLCSDFLLFIRTFFKIVTGREFHISTPPGRESHFITLARELTDCFHLKTTSLIVNMPPGYAKSTMLSYWTAWTMAMHPDSQYLYISYGHELASKHTEMIKRIMTTAEYKILFGVQLRRDSKAKDHFMTESGGSVKAFGSSGGIVGHDGGLPNLSRFSGAVLMDDLHKIDEAHSDTIRAKVIENYKETIIQRPRAPNVPMIFIGQRVHEADIVSHMLSGNDERKWKTVILKSIDDAGNALYPEVNSLEQLKIKERVSPYVFASQFQQNPIPPGGSLFKPEWFVLLDEYPKILSTFITADTAETEKSYNDASVFSFWGIYEIEFQGKKTGELGLHWIDCIEIRVEPKDLKDAFMDFYSDCCRFHVSPRLAAIEKKSTGVTLLSILKEIQGIQIRDIERDRSSKTDRFIRTQPYIASRNVSILASARHKIMCIDHMSKITANNSHRHDDIADTLSDAVKIALIDKLIPIISQQDINSRATIMQKQKQISQLRSQLYGGYTGQPR